MCGIAGIIGANERQDIERMTESLIHRGPDDQGEFFDGSIALGHTRLSILDVSAAGHQPMFTPDKKLAIVFNGEIYNYKSLRAELEGEGFEFISTSDTEVVLALYKKFGELCFEKLNGMFAIAIYDFAKQVLVLARDRMGKKPLYWSKIGNNFIFASELKALFTYPAFVKELDVESLRLYLANDYVPTPRTMFKGVYKLEPATYLRYQNNIVEKKQFWSLNFIEQSISFDDAVHGLDVQLNRSVSSRLVADVPLGIFLSGGLDSSTVAYYAQKNSSESVRTFSIGFDEASFDESEYAKLVASSLGTQHNHMIVTAKDSLEIIPQIAEMLDEPLADASIVPTYILSRFTKKQVTVALGGDGGDELFAGYTTFDADKYAAVYSHLPKAFQKYTERIISNLHASENNLSLGFKLKKFVSGFSDDPFISHQQWLGTFNTADQNKLLTAGVLAQSNFFSYDTWVKGISETINAHDPRNKMLGVYMRTYLMDEVLVKVDRASMFASLEVRAPFLDYELVEFVNSLPYEFKMKRGTGKYILKKLMADKLPASIVHRSKKGFGIPVAKWAKHELLPLFQDLLAESAIKKQGLFNADYVSQLLKDHISNRSDNRKQLWNLVVFQLWYRRWFSDPR